MLRNNKLFRWIFSWFEGKKFFWPGNFSDAKFKPWNIKNQSNCLCKQTFCFFRSFFFLSATVYLFALLVTGMLPAKNRLKCHWKIFGDNMEATNIDCTVLIFYVWALQKWSTNKVKLDFRQCQQAFKKNLLKRFVSPWKLADWSRKRAAMNTIKKTRPCTVQLTFFLHEIRSSLDDSTRKVNEKL